MPVKSKRNAISRKPRTESAANMYSNSLLDDTPSTSAASTPPEPMRTIEAHFQPPPFDTGPAVAREVDVESGDERLLGCEDEVSLVEEPVLPVPPPRSTIRGSPFVHKKAAPDPPAIPQEFLVDIEPSEPRERGHVRSPVLAREPSTLESFSRTIRGYVPSSIPIPSVAPTPPRVSRPLSFGSFLTPSRAASSSSSRSRGAEFAEGKKRRGSDVSADQRVGWNDRGLGPEDGDDAVFSLDEEFGGVEPVSATRYPGTGSGEDVMWSHWDSIEDSNAVSRRILVLGYPTGLQIWDCSNLASASEILNLSGHAWSDIRTANVLSNPLPGDAKDVFEAQRPLIGIVSAKNDTTEFLAYSLRTHTVVKTIRQPSLVSFFASREFVVLSTAQPPALHILSSRTLSSLYTVPSSSLLTFAHTPSSEPNNSVSVPRLDESNNAPHSATQLTAIPQPVFSLSNRLLAFASPPPQLDSPLESPSRIPRTASQVSQDDNTLKFPRTQADLGVAAVKIGGSVLSGMKVLGGMAFTAARAGVSAAAGAAERRYSTDTTNTTPVAPGKFFSRSAPAASGGEEQTYTRQNAEAPTALDTAAVDQRASGDNAQHITVLDLHSLRSAAPSPSPTRITEFFVGKEQPISLLQFSHDGTSLMVATSGGQTMKVYQLRPSPALISNAGAASAGPSPPWHIYDLRRGRTSAIVDSLTWAHDGRWMAVATEKGTVHVFATNPYGGPSDEQSHLNGRVSNTREVQPLSTELSPLIRLRVQKAQTPDALTVPLAFTFLPLSTPLPSTLSPQHHAHQDVLIFNPQDGALSLRRIRLSKQTRERVPSTFGPVPLPGGTSVSLPGMSTLSRLGTSAPADSSHAPSGLSRMMARSTEIVASENVVATWILRRSKEWKEIRRALRAPPAKARLTRVAKPDWVSQAELSTHSRSTRIVPRSIYLAHQFSFYFLGEDYHGLLRSYNFDVPATKIEVRRQIEVSASGSSVSESFVSGSSVPSQSAFSASFDEPLASALSGDLRHLSPSPPVIPMYPNGPPSRAYRNAVPIRNVAAGISDGMSEGLGRLRREIGKVRSPRLAPKRDSLSAPVPLEFDEEDEDFLLPAGDGMSSLDDGLSRTTSREGALLSTPSTGIEPLPLEEEGGAAWEGWGPEDKLAVEEIEQFDDIAVGFMDEELVRPAPRRR